MALHSNLVMDPLGDTSGGPENMSPAALRREKNTYTIARLGLTFAGPEQDVGETAADDSDAKALSPEPHDPEAIDSRLGVLPDEPQPASDSRCRIWPRFRGAVASLTAGISSRIVSILAPAAGTGHDELPVDAPLPGKHTSLPDPDRQTKRKYRKGTFKMPAELLVRLKACAESCRSYQYTLVDQAVDQFLQEQGFIPAEEENNSQGR